jgi:iron(III) transport system permease protein
MKLFGFFHIAAPYTLDHWRDVLNDPIFLGSLTNSLLLSGGAGLGGVIIYAVVAYLIVRSPLPGRGIVDLLAWLPWSIPGILLGVSVLWLILASPVLSFLYGSLASLVLIMIVAQMPIGVHMMKTSIRQIAVELEHSSRVCGAGPIRTFYSIVLPLIRPMLVSIFVIVFISALRDISTIIFLASARSQTLSLLMMQFATSSNLEASAVIGVITTAIVVVVALLTRRFGLAVSVQR